MIVIVTRTVTEVGESVIVKDGGEEGTEIVTVVGMVIGVGVMIVIILQEIGGVSVMSPLALVGNLMRKDLNWLAVGATEHKLVNIRSKRT